MDPKTGLYSRAAQLVRDLPQEKGTAEQMLAAIRKRGAKPVELQGDLPTGPITREKLARAIERNVPGINITQYGENPGYMKKGEGRRFVDLQGKKFREGLTPEEKIEHDQLMRRSTFSPNVETTEGEDGEDEEPAEPGYDEYSMEGGRDYRERLLKLRRRPGDNSPRFRSAHWKDHPDVLAHIRMQDRTHYDPQIGDDPKGWATDKLIDLSTKLGEKNPYSLGSGAAERGVAEGILTPEEAATLSRAKGWRNAYSDKPGLDRRLLHVEEIQSDWGQGGRDKGFDTGEEEKAYHDFVEQLGARARADGLDPALAHWGFAKHYGVSDEMDRLADARVEAAKKQRVPAGPYVQNTQHWTDLALKNVLQEAALGRYDGIVFTPGQAQADRYGLEKQVDTIKYFPEDRTLSALQNNRTKVAQQNVAPEDLPSLIGKELTEKLLHPDSVRKSRYGGDPYHVITGDDLKIGGGGMKSYYDQIVPKSVTRLAQMHDPDVKPGEPVQMTSPDGEDYQGFHLPMTDKLRDSITKEGFPAFRRGGRVAYANGGQADNGSPEETRAAPGGLPVAGGVRGGAGVLPAQDEKPLEGLPAAVRVPLTGQVIQSGPDARIRGVARDYMAEAGLPYQPPTKYAKVDPPRAARIAKAYDDMRDDPSDPLTKASYDAMIRETMAQYNTAKRAGLKVEFWHPDRMDDPYKASPRLATEDVRKNHHMWVFPTYAGYGSEGGPTNEDAQRNPLLQLTGETWNGIPVTVNDVFRAVHDYFGHAKEGVGFRHDGEENAWRSHASMYSPLARMAMTSETRGQNSWLNFGPHGAKNRSARTEDTVFAPQKIGVMPHWAHHEGAEDFMRPEDIDEMARIRARHDPSVLRALDMTRRFTKDGQGAILNLKR